MSTLARILRLLATVVLALAFPASALATGGHYVFQGGNAYEQGQVKQALDISAFNWSLETGTVTIVIQRDIPVSEALPGKIWLDADLLDAGEFSWGVVQHEYAHTLDVALFNDTIHAQLLPILGGHVWFGDPVHSENAGERFASTLSCAYWPSQENIMCPASGSSNDEGGALSPLAFRTLLRQTLIGLGVQGADALPLALPQAKPQSPSPRPAKHKPLKQKTRRS
jgi:hypothetical protein